MTRLYDCLTRVVPYLVRYLWYRNVNCGHTPLATTFKASGYCFHQLNHSCCLSVIHSHVTLFVRVDEGILLSV